MGILLAFAPFFVFAVVDRLRGLDRGPGGRCCDISDFGPAGLEEISRKPQGSGGWDTHPV